MARWGAKQAGRRGESPLAAGLHMGQMGYVGWHVYVHTHVNAPSSLTDSLKGCLDPYGLNFGAILRSLLKHSFPTVQTFYPRKGFKWHAEAAGRTFTVSWLLVVPWLKSAPFLCHLQITVFTTTIFATLSSQLWCSKGIARQSPTQNLWAGKKSSLRKYCLLCRLKTL